MSPLLSLRQVRREYVTGDQVTAALAGVDLEIDEGEFVAIIGPSGSGKSTLMNMIGCLDRPTSGSVVIDGSDVSTLSDNELTELRLRTIGFVFQQFNLLPQTSALDNAAAPLLYAGESPARARARAAEVLERLGLGDRAKFQSNRLSGGQQQRVAIARALVSDPRILLADEPTGALDSTSGAEVMRIIHEIHAGGRTVILITHDHDIASQAQRQIQVRDGRIVSDSRNPELELMEVSS
jgi:putative ABC transport system ATP-binding protein